MVRSIRLCRQEILYRNDDAAILGQSEWDDVMVLLSPLSITRLDRIDMLLDLNLSFLY